jgi:hypothetical protein
VVGRERGITEKKMFGTTCFMLRGNVCVGIWQDSLIARVGKDAYRAALRLPHACEFDFTGRPMTGWIVVAAEGIDTERDLRAWIDRSLEFVGSLAAKTKT